MALSLSALFSVETAASILERGLEIARVLKLPVSSWRAGDPTRSLYKFLAEVQASKEELASQFIKSGFLSTAEGEWKKLHAIEVYGITPTEATYARPDVTLLNTGGGLYVIEPGDLTIKASTIEKTYHNVTGGTLASGPGTTLTLTFEADEPGADSSVTENEIDEMVTTLLGVEIQSSTAALASDEQSDESIEAQCNASLGALSPNGPEDAYEFVVRNQELTGVTDITRARAEHDSTDGTVIVYVASAAGPVAVDSITAAQSAVERWATPLCVTPTVVNATATLINVEGTIVADDLPPDFAELCEAAIAGLFAAIPIGGTVARSAVIGRIVSTLKAAGVSEISMIITLAEPSSDVVLEPDAVPVLDVFDLTEA
jgi:hypothetical protein